MEFGDLQFFPLFSQLLSNHVLNYKREKTNLSNNYIPTTAQCCRNFLKNISIIVLIFKEFITYLERLF